MVGDEASGLTKLATTSLEVIKGPDLFHVQQEITRGLTGRLARECQQRKKEQEELQQKKQEALTKCQKYEIEQELSKQELQLIQKVIELGQEEKFSNEKIEIAEKRYKDAQEDLKRYQMLIIPLV